MKVIATKNAPAAVGPYSQAIDCSDTVYCSGQIPLDPQTGEVLAMVSAPSYDPRIMVGRSRSKNHRLLSRDAWKPLLNRSIMGMYPPGSTFKTSQALTYMTEGIIPPSTAFPCNHGLYCRGLHVGCHSHAAPIALVDAISTSCNAYFCWGLYYMMGNRAKYKAEESYLLVINAEKMGLIQEGII